MSAPVRLDGFEVASPAPDPEIGAVAARAWLADRRPGVTPVRMWTHTALYRGPDDVSTRVSLELAPISDGAAAHVESLTLLIRSRGDGTAVSEFPSDPALPSLETMLDPRSAAGVLSQAVPELSQGPERHADLRCDVTLVHHPRTGACVLRYDVHGSDGRTRREVYAKIYPSVADVRRSASAHQAVGGRLLNGPEVVVRMPRLLGVDIDTRAVFIESLGSGATPVEIRPDEAARVIATLHGATAVDDLPTVAAVDEADRVRAELALVRTAWPELAARVAGHLDTAAEHLARSTEGRRVLSHGDFTPSQLLRMPREVIGLLDLDTLRLAEPATDLGRYLAYESVRLARRERRDPADPPGAVADHVRSRVDELYAVVLAAYGVTDPALAERVVAHARLQLTLLALRAARRFKDDRVRLALTLLDHAPSRRPS